MRNGNINRSEISSRTITAADDFFFILYRNGEHGPLRAGKPNDHVRELAASAGNEIVILRRVDDTPDPRSESAMDPARSYLIA